MYIYIHIYTYIFIYIERESLQMALIKTILEICVEELKEKYTH